MKYLLILTLFFLPFSVSANCYKVSIKGGYSDMVKKKAKWQNDSMGGATFDVDLDPNDPQLRKFKNRTCEITGPNMMVCTLKHYDIYLTETWLIAPHIKAAYTTKVMSGGEKDSQVSALSGKIIGKCTEAKNNS